MNCIFRPLTIVCFVTFSFSLTTRAADTPTTRPAESHQHPTAGQLAFPGAEGYGRFAKGGRGGKVYEITTLDGIITYVRTRVGDVSGKTYDGMGFASSDNCIIDHCSISWTIDESVSSRGAKNITFQRNIIAEALNMSVHSHYVGTGKGHSS